MQVRLSQMLMNTVVSWRLAWEVVRGAEVLESSRSLPVCLHGLILAVKPLGRLADPSALTAACRPNSYCISICIHLNHHFVGLSSLTSHSTL